MRYRSVTTAALSALAILSAACGEPVHRTESWPAMDRELTVEVYMATERDADVALGDARAAVEKVEAAMSFDRPDSELSRLNREAVDGYYAIEDPDLYRCLLLALDYARASRGAFDPTVGALMRLYGAAGSPRVPLPGEIDGGLASVGWDRVTLATEARSVHFRDPGIRLDLGGVVKGYALDVAGRVLTRPGSRAALLRMGGNMLVWNHPPGADAWNVEVPDPRRPGGWLVRVQVANRGLSVSANPPPDPSASLDPSGLVLDPESGRPAGADILAAVAIAHSAADADALSTALFASGYHEATDLLGRMRQVEAILLVRGDERPYLLATAPLKGRLELSPELEAETGGEIRYTLPVGAADERPGVLEALER